MVLFFGAAANPDERGRPLRFVVACTGQKRASGLQAGNLGVNGRKDVLCIHFRKVSEAGLIASYVSFYIPCDASVLGPNRHQYT